MKQRDYDPNRTAVISEPNTWVAYWDPPPVSMLHWMFARLEVTGDQGTSPNLPALKRKHVSRMPPVHRVYVYPYICETVFGATTSLRPTRSIG
jgi:hypothetical protein